MIREGIGKLTLKITLAAKGLLVKKGTGGIGVLVTLSATGERSEASLFQSFTLSGNILYDPKNRRE